MSFVDAPPAYFQCKENLSGNDWEERGGGGGGLLTVSDTYKNKAKNSKIFRKRFLTVVWMLLTIRTMAIC
jgi:hypothetical protein